MNFFPLSLSLCLLLCLSLSRRRRRRGQSVLFCRSCDDWCREDLIQRHSLPSYLHLIGTQEREASTGIGREGVWYCVSFGLERGKKVQVATLCAWNVLAKMLYRMPWPSVFFPLATHCRMCLAHWHHCSRVSTRTTSCQWESPRAHFTCSDVMNVSCESICNNPTAHCKMKKKLFDLFYLSMIASLVIMHPGKWPPHFASHIHRSCSRATERRASSLFLCWPLVTECPFLLPASSLKIKQLNVPIAVEYGSDVTLVCDFDLEGEILYSVKWYKNLVEFYRFLPSNVPNSATAISMNGFTVEVSRLSITSEPCHCFLLSWDLYILLKDKPFQVTPMFVCVWPCYPGSLSISHVWWAFSPPQSVNLCSGCARVANKASPGHLLPSWLRRGKKTIDWEDKHFAHISLLFAGAHVMLRLACSSMNLVVSHHSSLAHRLLKDATWVHDDLFDRGVWIQHTDTSFIYSFLLFSPV